MERFKKTNLSAYGNFLLAKYEAYTGSVRVQSRPYYAMIDPCDICQLRCPTCPTGIENEGRLQNNTDDTTYRSTRSMLTTELFDALLDEMSEHLFLITFHSWGEPLLNLQTPAFVRKAASESIKTHIHTNLSLRLTDELIEELLESGLDFLVASVDGFSQQAYEKFRVGGDVELVKSNLKRAAIIRDRLGLHTSIIYKFLVFSWNEHEVHAAQEFSEQIGINFDAQDAGIPDASWLPSYRKGETPFLSAENIDTLDRQWKAAGKGDYWKEHEKHPYWYPIEAGTHWIPTEGRQGDSFCGWHYGVAVIQPGGEVAPCCFTSKESDRFGSVVPGQTRFGDIWNNDIYRKSREAFTDVKAEDLARTDSVCTRCYFPNAVKHVYSNYDAKIIEQFSSVYGDSDPVLDQAFRLLSNDETESHRRSFVDFFEKNLMPHIS